MPCGCSATLRSLSHFFLLLPAFGQLLCPVFHFIYFVPRSAPLHVPLCKAGATVLTGFHYAQLRKPFTSVAFSSLAAFCCYARLAATGCVSGYRWPSLIRVTPYATRYPFTVRPSPPPKRGLNYPAPAGGTRPRFVVPPSRLEGEQRGSVPQACGTAKLPLAAGASTLQDI